MIWAYGIWACFAGFALWMGWPFWPILTITTALLTVFAWRIGGDWLIPASALVGYLLMRLVVLLDPQLAMYAAGALWLAVGAFMIHRGWLWSGYAYLTSGAVYPLCVIFGLRITYLGFVAIIADLLAISALMAIHGGLRGVDASRASDRPSGTVGVLQNHKSGLAQDQSPSG